MTKKLSLAGLLVLFATNGMAAGEFYCCQDPGNGRRVCGDTLPDQCRGRGYRVFDSGANLIKEVGPALTPEQKAEQAVELRRKKQQEEAARELRRRDQALLDTYATPRDIDMAQQKAEADATYAIQNAQAAINEAAAKRNKLEKEAEFYKKKTLPAELARELNALNHQIRLHQDLVDLKTREFGTIKAKYDADRKRYFELTRRPVAPAGQN